MQIIQSFIHLGSSAMMPIIIFFVSIIFRIPLKLAFKSGMYVGIGFIGINMVMELLLKQLTPVTKAMINGMGLNLKVIDVGWTTGANIGWNSPIMLTSLIGFFLINVVLLILNLTKTVDIDIFNFWTLLLLGALTYSATRNYWTAVGVTWVLFIIALLVGDKTAPRIQKQFHLNGLSFPQIAYLSWIPFGIAINWFVENIPLLKKIELSPETISARIGIFGEPVSIGFILGIFLGVMGHYSAEQAFVLAVNVSGCMVILPRMITILVEGLEILRSGVSKQLKTWFPAREFFIAMDVSVLIGDPAVMTTGLLMIPFSLFLSFVLPGNKILPLADLTSIMFPFTLSAAYMQRNIFRMMFAGPLIIVAALYLSSYVSPEYTKAFLTSGIRVSAHIDAMSNFIGSAGTWIGGLLIAIVRLLKRII